MDYSGTEMAHFLGLTTSPVNRVTVAEVLPQGQELPERASEPTSPLLCPHFVWQSRIFSREYELGTVALRPRMFSTISPVSVNLLVL